MSSGKKTRPAAPAETKDPEAPWETPLKEEIPGVVTPVHEGVPLSKMRRTEDIAGSQDARRTAAVVLEVLAGIRSPTEAANTLGVSGTHYYNLEVRAVQGVVAAFEPRPQGKPVDLEGKIRGLEREKKRLEVELSRTRTLLRMAQRAVGIHEDEKGGKSPERRRARPGRRPTVRAKRAVTGLLEGVSSPSEEVGEGFSEGGSV